MQAKPMFIFSVLGVSVIITKCTITVGLLPLANYRHCIQLLYIHSSLSHSTQSKGAMNTEQNYGMTDSTHISGDTKGAYEIPESIQPQPTDPEEGVYEGVY